MSEPRASAGVSTAKLVDTTRQLISILVGVVLAGVGVFVLVGEVQHTGPGIEAHKAHIYIAVALIAFGSFLIVPSTVTKVFVTIVPYIPILGGRRREDPPTLPPADKPAA